MSGATEPRYLVTSHSIDGTIESCMRRFEFKHVLGVVPDVDESGYAAEAGTAMHEALQEWARRGQDEQAGYLTLVKWWPWKLEAKRERADARSFENATVLLHQLMNHPIWEDWEVATLPSGELAIEVPYRINYHSLGTFKHPRFKDSTYLASQGKIDFIMRHKQSGILMPLDLKTTMYGEEAHEAAFRFSGQQAEYGMVLSAAVGHDFITHGLRVCYLIGTYLSDGVSVNQFEYSLSADEVQDAIRTKRNRLESVLRHARENWWPRRSHGCTFFAQPCGFLDVCHRRDLEFLLPWFAAEASSFRFKERIYDPFWILEA